jgi:hypothetical protein
MKVTDFYIGLEFQSTTKTYRCTDVGTRTITAITLDKDDERWYAGPPYMVPERIFDEEDLRHLFLSDSHAIMQSFEEVDELGLTFSSSSVRQMRRAVHDPVMNDYQNKSLLRHDKLIDGEIHHPYAANNPDPYAGWVVLCYLPYCDKLVEVPELDFRDAPYASRQDYLDSNAKHTRGK